jgi:hypothetical protein
MAFGDITNAVGKGLTILRDLIEAHGVDIDHRGGVVRAVDRNKFRDAYYETRSDLKTGTRRGRLSIVCCLRATRRIYSMGRRLAGNS